jgi:hypothetical protein
VANDANELAFVDGKADIGKHGFNDNEGLAQSLNL